MYILLFEVRFAELPLTWLFGELEISHKIFNFFFSYHFIIISSLRGDIVRILLKHISISPNFLVSFHEIASSKRQHLESGADASVASHG